MPKFVGDDISVVINGVDLSTHVKSADVKEKHGVVEVTGMGASGDENILTKKKISTVDIEFWQSYDASSVNATLRPLVGSNTAFTVVVKPTSASVSATNPSYTGVMKLPEWDAIVVGGVGEASVPKASFVNGDTVGIVEATS